MEADERLCRAHGFDQRADADDGHDTFEIVGQHVQCHLGAHVLQPLHEEVRRAHPGLDGAEGIGQRDLLVRRLAPLGVEP